MALGAFIKDPDATLDYSFDWDDWLADTEIILSSTWVVPSGITKDSDTYTDTTTTIWLSGGTAGYKYTVANRIVTSDGRTDDRSIEFTIRDR